MAKDTWVFSKNNMKRAMVGRKKGFSNADKKDEIILKTFILAFIGGNDLVGLLPVLIK